MNERVSRLLVAIEALCFLAPITALTVGYSRLLINLYLFGLAHQPAEAHITTAFVFIGLVLQLLAWWTLANFVLRGREGLASVNRTCIGAIYVGAGLAIVGGVSLVLAFAFGGTLAASLSVNAFGLPALIPFAHVALERHYATAKP
jgi:hypothetical protein